MTLSKKAETAFSRPFAAQSPRFDLVPEKKSNPTCVSLVLGADKAGLGP
jgi:hypothetical protein